MKSLIYLIITLCILNYVIPEETTPCTGIEPKQSSDCTDHEITEEEIEEYYEEDYDNCCYLITQTSNSEKTECVAIKKSDANEIIKGYDKQKAEKEILDYTLMCLQFGAASSSDSESDSGPDSDSGSIWLSLSLTFLIFGLVF